MEASSLMAKPSITNIIGYILILTGVGLVIADVVQLGIDVPMDVLTLFIFPIGIAMAGIKI